MSKEDGLYTRRDSLRLEGFDYAARRVYFVTLVVAGRRKVFRDERLARASVSCLVELRQRLNFRVYVYTLMHDHFHALLGLGESGKTLGEVCGAFKSLTTRAYWRWYEGRLWQRQFYDHVVRNEDDFFETLEYIELNPVRRGLVESWKAWPYAGRVD
jgi:REP element-mobilizing transposase RayT